MSPLRFTPADRPYKHGTTWGHAWCPTKATCQHCNTANSGQKRRRRGRFRVLFFILVCIFQKIKNKKVSKKISKNIFFKKKQNWPNGRTYHQRLSPGNPAQAISGPYPQWLARNRAPSSKNNNRPPIKIRLRFN